MFETPRTLSVTIRNFAVVTYAVPAERVRIHLPDAYELETFDGDEGETALISSTVFCNEDFRWTPLPYPKLTFDESTYRTYVKQKGRRGAFFFHRYLSRIPAHLPQRILDMHAERADFNVRTVLSSGGFEDYMSSVEGVDGASVLRLRATEQPAPRPPFARGEDLAQHITYRLHGFFTTSAGFQGHMPVRHPRMRPWSGSLEQATFPVWERLGILSAEEAQDPYSVLVEEEVPFRLYPPRPLL